MNYTTYYELPQYQGSDKTAWLTTFNSAMAAIDAGIHDAKAEADANALSITTLQSTVETISGTVSTQGTTLDTVASNLTTLTGTVNTITALIGNGEPTTTDKTLIGAINELDLTKLDASDLTGKRMLVQTTNVVVTADGVKDVSTLLHEGVTELLTKVSQGKTVRLESISIGDYSDVRPTKVYQMINSADSFFADCDGIYMPSAASAQLLRVSLNSSAAGGNHFYSAAIDGTPSVTFTNHDSEVLTADTKIYISYSVYQEA